MPFKRLIGWITGETECLCKKQRDIRHMVVLDEFQKLQDLVILQGTMDARRYAEMSGGILAIGRGLKILVEKAEEEALGPMVYDISANDLYLLSKYDREIVRESGVSYFNDVIPVRLVGVDCCDLETVERIMEWKRECVSRITQEQVVEAIEEQQS